MKNIIIFFITIIPNIVFAANPIRIAGSATVYPFITLAVEQFGGKTSYPAPIVENIGSGGGIKLFCTRKIDMAISSRKMKPEEIEFCADNQIEDIKELIIGYDGIVIANSIKSFKFHFSSRDLYLALAKNIPHKGKMVSNFYKKWNEINPSFPEIDIEIYGPTHNSGTREALTDLLLVKYCENLEEMKNIYPDASKRISYCKEIRDDGKFIEIGENYNLIIQKIKLNLNSLGIFGFNFFENNSKFVQANAIDDIIPTSESISSTDYMLSRGLYLYYKESDLSNIAIKSFIEEVNSDAATGKEGYLTKAGMVVRE